MEKTVFSSFYSSAKSVIYDAALRFDQYTMSIKMESSKAMSESGFNSEIVFKLRLLYSQKDP